MTGILAWLAQHWLVQRAKALLGPVWAFLSRYPMQCAIVILIALSAWLWRGWDHEKAGRHADAVAFQQVMDAARVNLAKLKAEKAAENARRAANTKRIDDATEPARAAALAAADAYRASHRCLWAPGPVAAASGQPGGNLPGSAAPAGSAEAPAEAVAVAPDAFNACTLNTADLWKAFQWAQGLSQPQSPRKDNSHAVQ